MSNSNDRSQQAGRSVNSSDTSNQSSVANVPTSETGRVSQFVSNVNVSNLIQSNSFLHSDFGNFIEIPQNNPMASARTNSTTNLEHAHTSHNHTHSHEPINQTVLNLPGSNNEDEAVPEQATDQTPAGTPGNNLVTFLISSLQSSFPFFLLLLAKIFHQHFLGFSIVIGFMTTLHWSNRSLVHQVELRDKKKNSRLLLLIAFLLLNATFFFFIFKKYELYKCLVFMAPEVKKMDTWNLIWIVACSDTIIKYLTICLKAIVTILPLKIMPLRKRGGYYSLIETSTQFYRSLTPIHPWFLFLFHTENITQLSTNATDIESVQAQESTIFPVFLCIIYSICKLNQLFNMSKELKNSYRDMKGGLSSARLNTTISENEDNICPICQDRLSSPVVLKCQHIFCEDCVCIWLDKENSCPMCRAKIAVKKPQYKDGSTTIFIQWY